MACEQLGIRVGRKDAPQTQADRRRHLQTCQARNVSCMLIGRRVEYWCTSTEFWQFWLCHEHIEPDSMLYRLTPRLFSRHDMEGSVPGVSAGVTQNMCSLAGTKTRKCLVERTVYHMCIQVHDSLVILPFLSPFFSLSRLKMPCSNSIHMSKCHTSTPSSCNVGNENKLKSQL